MKKLVLILTLIFTALISFTQTTWTIPKSEGSPKNLTTLPGGFRVPNGIIIGRFADTTAANLISAKFHDGSVILVGESLYQRQLSSNRWLLIGGSGSTDTTSLSNRINLKLNIADTANIRLRPIAGTNITITGTYPNLTFNSAGGEGSTDTTSLSNRINLKVNISDTAAMLTPYPVISEVRQVVSDSMTELTIGVGLELINDTLLSLKLVTPYEIGGVNQDQVNLWDNSEPSLGLPSVSGYVLSSGTDGIRSWVDYVSPTGTQTLTNKRITQRVNTISSSSTPTPTSDISDMFTVTALAEAATFAAPTGTPTDGQSLLLRIKDNGTARTLGWNEIYRAGSDFALPTTTVISKTIYLQLVYNAADSKWDAVDLSRGY